VVQAIYPERLMDRIWEQSQMEYQIHDEFGFDVQKWVDRWAQVLLPLGGVWMLLAYGVLGRSWQQSLLQGALLYLVGCPCFLLFVQPVFQWGLIDTLKTRGWLLNISRLSSLGKQAVLWAFDKTGTLTELRLDEASQDQLCRLPWGLKNRLRQILELVRNHFPHPKTEALWRALWEAQNHEAKETMNAEVPAESVGNYQIFFHPQQGVRLIRGDEQWWFGQGVFNLAQDPEMEGATTELQDDAVRTQLLQDHVRLNNQTILSYQVREDFHPMAQGLIDRLHRTLSPVYNLSGDPHPDPTWHKQAQVLGLHVSTGLSPEQKKQILQQQKKKGFFTVFVGDGINDWPALREADLAVVVQPREGPENLGFFAASFVLPKTDLAVLPKLLDFLRLWRARMHGAFWAGVIYNLTVILLILSPWFHPLFLVLLMSLGNLWIWWFTYYSAKIAINSALRDSYSVPPIIS